MSDAVARAKLARVDRLESLEEAKRRDYDCFSCRVMGATAFVGLGAFSFISGHRGLTQREAEIMKSSTRIRMPARRMGVTLTSAVFVGVGIYRFFV